MGKVACEICNGQGDFDSPCDHVGQVATICPACEGEGEVECEYD